MTTETALNPDNDAIENDISQATAANESEHDSKIGQEGIPVAETETAEAAQILNSADTREQSLAATEDSPEEAAEINR